MRTAYFPVVPCRSLFFDLLILTHDLEFAFAFSALGLGLQHLTRKFLLGDFRTEDAYTYSTSGLFLRKMLGTRYGSVGTRFL